MLNEWNSPALIQHTFFFDLIVPLNLPKFIFMLHWHDRSFFLRPSGNTHHWVVPSAPYLRKVDGRKSINGLIHEGPLHYRLPVLLFLSQSEEEFRILNWKRIPSAFTHLIHFDRVSRNSFTILKHTRSHLFKDLLSFTIILNFQPEDSPNHPFFPTFLWAIFFGL